MQKVWKWLQLGIMSVFLLMTVSAEAAQITDVKWGVNKDRDLRIVVDVDESAGYDAKLDGNNVKLTVSASKASKVASRQTVRSDIATSLRVDGKGANTEIIVPLAKKVDSKAIKAFVLRQDPKTGRPFRVVLDVLQPDRSSSAAASTVAAGASRGSSASRGPVISNKPSAGSTGSSKSTVSSGTKNDKSKDTKKDNKKNKKKDNDKKKDTKKSTAASNAAATNSSTSSNTSNSTAATTTYKRKSPFRTSGGIKGKLITLDPDHGGSDPGANGQGGMKEKEGTLPIDHQKLE